MHANFSSLRRSICLALAAVSGLAFSAQGLAQNALGDGRALDANLQQGYGRFNPAGRNANMANEIRFRNAIVTGNAPNGLSFRGDAGYLAADDFSAETGENTLYDFQRDSLYSGLATRNIRNIDALRAQMSLATGGAPTFDTGGLFINRAGFGSTSGDLSERVPQISIDPFNTRIGSMRSTATFLGGQSLEPQFFGSTQDQNGQAFAIGASPLRGVIAQQLFMNPDALAPLPQLPGNVVAPTGASPANREQNTGDGLTPGGLVFNPRDLPAIDGASNATTEEPAPPRPGQIVQTPMSNRIAGEVPRDSLGTNEISDRITPRSPYESIISEFITPIQAPSDDAEDADTDDAPAESREQVAADTRSFLDRVEDLRREILGLPPRDDEVEAEGAEALEVIDARTGEVVEATESLGGVESVRERAAKTFGEATTPTLKSLASSGADTSVFGRYLREGEGYLKAQRWFDAEESFTRAINRQSGDPIASAGRISAQLGAGMYLSASVNLRALFSAHPEMAAVRFRPDLFLSGNRLQQVQLYLRDESVKERPFARDAAILLAYIGYQTGDLREVRNAFNAYDRNAMSLSVEPDPLVEMLKGAWIDAPERRNGSR